MKYRCHYENNHHRLSTYKFFISYFGGTCSFCTISLLLLLQLSWGLSSIFASSFVIIPTLQFPSKRNDRPTTIKSTSPSPKWMSSTSSSNNKSKPYLEIIHPQTNTTVILIGCLHGASSSAKDVSNILNESPTDVIVLELCPTRYKDLMKYMTKKKSLQQTSSRNSNNNLKNGAMSDADDDEMNTVIGQDYINMISKTIKYNGVSTGIAAAILGAASGLSSTFSGFEAGLEFTTAIEYVQNYNQFYQSYQSNNSDTNRLYHHPNCDIILGDRLVDETLKRVGSLPKISLDMWNEFIQKLNWTETYGKDAITLSDAIEGDKSLKNNGLQIELASVLFRDKDVMIDLFRLFLPTFVFIQMVALITMFIGDNSYSIDNAMIDLAPTFTRWDWIKLICDFGLESLTSVSIIFFGYMALVLPSVRIILLERDYQLANAIHAACQVSMEKYNQSANASDSMITSNRRVVAILGLLHVNGVAKRLLVSEYEK